MSNGSNDQNKFISRAYRHKRRKKKLRFSVMLITSLLIIASLMVLVPIFYSESKPNDIHVMSNKEPLELKRVEHKEKVKGENQKIVQIEQKEEISSINNIEDKEIVETKINIVEKVKAENAIIHKVKPGETLYSITMIYFSNSNQQKKLASINGLKNPEKELKAGMKLTIPNPDFMFFHHVKKGETLISISKKYYGTSDYIRSLASFNGIKDLNNVKFGTKLRIPNPASLLKNEELPKQERETQVVGENATGKKEVNIVINKKTNQLIVYKDNKMIKTFSVGTGKNASTTPEGSFKIVNKIKNPWYSTKGIPGGDPKNPLGSRWLGLNVPGTGGTKYGIHGTNDPSSIGKHISLGCIRMHNADVEWLYNNITLQTTVSIVSH
ncbi:L,D-transpeptidase family protein [Ferdinandcohnia quinoae]|uniref:L,D-transpeptidase family protein n=1 Tax=Fredinandcohnia quinoae TaxID=2918902 RepID=A0AAW5E218_9BACI|nr:L,D-transpeptidase family protein [Fredinandcohnia sp. SECRCQ15]MCH1624117.1 L,D-transpeptidase family protein [Fredinandcohnia sp. SECRCQ15]